ncbi:unnamed protein product [Darwinula stevensoni]|uniref:Uncharacterized protein n=1 Tax=Darwinula stevensoni TaxID=69355 RepID=A0A7R8XA58_9CRUS|nr:unnamed protein product [Darwinula stevensoni]CAG0889677.1 unnamed protein product [Darwinula stevensoni]
MRKYFAAVQMTVPIVNISGITLESDKFMASHLPSVPSFLLHGKCTTRSPNAIRPSQETLDGAGNLEIRRKSTDFEPLSQTLGRVVTAKTLNGEVSLSVATHEVALSCLCIAASFAIVSNDLEGRSGQVPGYDRNRSIDLHGDRDERKRAWPQRRFAVFVPPSSGANTHDDMGDAVALGLGFTEAALTITSLSLYRSKGNELALPSYDKHNLVIGTLISFIIITPALLFIYIIGQSNVRKSTAIALMNAMGFTLFLAGGTVVLDYFTHGYQVSGGNVNPFDTEHRNLGLATGSVMIVNSIFYLADSLVNMADICKK